jgi:hypothetical protein
MSFALSIKKLIPMPIRQTPKMAIIVLKMLILIKCRVLLTRTDIKVNQDISDIICPI